jgi:hypothetical protein
MLLRGLAVVTCAIATLAAQAAPGSLRGAVTDQSGGLIPGVEVTATGTTGETRRVVSNNRGEFLFEALPAGTYQLTARLPGFRGERVEVKVGAGAVATWSPQLTLPFSPAVPFDSPATGIDPTNPQVAREIYSLIASFVKKRPGTLAVYEKSLAPPLRDIDDWLTGFGPVWDDMRKSVTAKTHAYPLTLRPDSLPAGSAFRDEKEIGHIHLNAAGSLESLQLSKVLLAPDGQAAVVAYLYSCGNLCGNGTLAFLRKRPDGSWSIAVQKELIVF